MVEGQSAPLGVKIISVLYYIGAALIILAAIIWLLFLFGMGALGSFLIGAKFAGFGIAMFLLVEIVILAFAVLSFFIARGLWKLKNWARITAIVLAGLGILSGVSFVVTGSFGRGIFSLIIQLAIGGYLLFSSEVKQAFA